MGWVEGEGFGQIGRGGAQNPPDGVVLVVRGAEALIKDGGEVAAWVVLILAGDSVQTQRCRCATFTASRLSAFGFAAGGNPMAAGSGLAECTTACAALAAFAALELDDHLGQQCHESGDADN
jgi:hypothetical protein